MATTPSSTALRRALATARWATRPSTTRRWDRSPSASRCPRKPPFSVLSFVRTHGPVSQAAFHGVHEIHTCAGASPIEQRPFAGAGAATLHCLVAVARDGSSRPECPNAPAVRHGRARARLASNARRTKLTTKSIQRILNRARRTVGNSGVVIARADSQHQPT